MSPYWCRYAGVAWPCWCVAECSKSIESASGSKENGERDQAYGYELMIPLMSVCVQVLLLCYFNKYTGIEVFEDVEVFEVFEVVEVCGSVEVSKILILSKLRAYESVSRRKEGKGEKRNEASHDELMLRLMSMFLDHSSDG